MKINKLFIPFYDVKADFQIENERLIFENNVPHEKILCIGDVQSGKTSIIIKSIRKAKELQYRSTIIFAGTNTSLVTQTINRLKVEEMDEMDYSIYGDEQIENIVEYKEKITTELKRKNKHLIFCFLKSKTIEKKLEKVMKFFESHFAVDEGLLIIDDECDSYSVVREFDILNKEKDEKNIAEKIFS
jgi:hypothetical protein